jgi:hypothetical protein
MKERLGQSGKQVLFFPFPFNRLSLLTDGSEQKLKIFHINVLVLNLFYLLPSCLVYLCREQPSSHGARRSGHQNSG